jgi:hypothetical protein
MLEKLPNSKDFYDQEKTQRESLRGAIGQPVALLSIVTTLLASMFQKFQMQCSLATALFVLVFLFACIAGAVAVTNLVRAYHGHTYKGVGSAEEIRTTRLALYEWYIGQGKSEADAEKDLLHQLDEQFSIAATHNAKVNERRSELLYLANRYIILGGAGAAFAFVPFLWNQLTVTPVTPVQIVDFTPRLYQKLLEHDRSKTTADAAALAAAAQTPASSPKGTKRRLDSAGSSKAR